jgi:hypothetical protein
MASYSTDVFANERLISTKLTYNILLKNFGLGLMFLKQSSATKFLNFFKLLIVKNGGRRHQSPFWRNADAALNAVIRQFVKSS